MDKSLPQALHIMWPASSRLHSGVIVVAQFWHAGIALVEAAAAAAALDAASAPFVPSLDAAFAWANANLAVFDTRLLNAGQPLQPC
jgi:hypothetical protein